MFVFRFPICSAKRGRVSEWRRIELGPGRVHHCMRAIGQCEVALDLMCERALERKAFGEHHAQFANIQDWIAESRLEIDQARLLVLKATHKMDRDGNAAARVDVSAIKIVAARLQTRIVDRAMQVFGAMGLTADTPLSYLWTWGRPLPLAHEPVAGLLAKQFFRGGIAIRGAELVSEFFARRFFDPRCQLGLAVHLRMQIQRIQSEQPRRCHRPRPTMTLAF